MFCLVKEVEGKSPHGVWGRHARGTGYVMELKTLNGSAQYGDYKTSNVTRKVALQHPRDPIERRTTFQAVEKVG